MVKCDLNSVELEEMALLFGRINQARAEIKAGISAQEAYAETVNEINCLSVEDSVYGEELCRKALEQLGLIRAAELAHVTIQNCQSELEVKYEIPGSSPKGRPKSNE
ncbi:MAG TPA: hypothetical protein VN426_05365 [Syntrophomonadaceae bacterium]|nr:hypothetical protein [Syntrophomonadaceae bacterium]